MAEEHGCQSPEGHRLCVNNCGFFGSPATGNMCSQCYRDVGPKNSGERTALISKPTSSSTTTTQPSSLLPSSSSPVSPVQLDVEPAAEEKEVVVVAVVPTTSNRCTTCRKKVGLTGFKCKCGTTFCGTHRYPEKHGCTFDFKAVGREAIAKANPLVKGEKLRKI